MPETSDRRLPMSIAIALAALLGGAVLARRRAGTAGELPATTPGQTAPDHQDEASPAGAGESTKPEKVEKSHKKKKSKKEKKKKPSSEKGGSKAKKKASKSGGKKHG